MFTLLCAISIQILKFFCKDRRLLLYMSRTLHLFGTDWCAMMVPIQVIRWYRMQCYDGTDSCDTVVPIRRYCHFTVSNASIFTKYLPNARKKKVGKHVPHIKQDLIYPAVLIGRLGISTKFQHLHIGTEVMDFIKSWFVEPYNKTGCRYLVVDAYNEDVPVAFYKKNGFDFMFSTEEQEKSYRGIVSDKPLKTRLMYFDLILIK